ncbi:MAG: hypothetical protein Q9162_002933 [Coniocarpon cinnabarinum]
MAKQKFADSGISTKSQNLSPSSKTDANTTQRVSRVQRWRFPKASGATRIRSSNPQTPKWMNVREILANRLRGERSSDFGTVDPDEIVRFTVELSHNRSTAAEPSAQSNNSTFKLDDNLDWCDRMDINDKAHGDLTEAQIKMHLGFNPFKGENVDITQATETDEDGWVKHPEGATDFSDSDSVAPDEESSIVS